MSKIDNLQNTIKANLKNISINFDFQNTINENEYDSVVTFDNKNKSNSQGKIEKNNYPQVTNLEIKPFGNI